MHTLATCPAPEEPYSGIRLISSGEFIPGSEVMYVCETNTELVGSDKRKCLPSGLWTGQQPTCQGELIRLYLSAQLNVTLNCLVVIFILFVRVEVSVQMFAFYIFFSYTYQTLTILKIFSQLSLLTCHAQGKVCSSSCCCFFFTFSFVCF